MRETTKRPGQDTLDVIRDLRSQGTHSTVVILRHSARHYDLEKLEKEAFFELTDEGKEFADEFGRSLPTDSLLRLFSSYAVRCVETAYLIERGNISQGGKTETNRITKKLITFFAIDSNAAMHRNVEKGDAGFFRDWFDHKIPLDVMADPRESAEVLLSHLIRSLDEIPEAHIDIHVSHDWHIYLLKECFLDLTIEDMGGAEYLEGVILYRDGSDLYLTNHQTDPKKLERKS
jgi:broad specificity phosphatase PhoE